LGGISAVHCNLSRIKRGTDMFQAIFSVDRLSVTVLQELPTMGNDLLSCSMAW